MHRITLFMTAAPIIHIRHSKCFNLHRWLYNSSTVWCTRVCMRVCACMYVCVCFWMHEGNSHNKFTCTLTYMYTTQPHTEPHVHAQPHTHTHPQPHTHTHTHSDTHAHSQPHACTPTATRTHTHPHTHTKPNTHRHIHICVCTCVYHSTSNVHICGMMMWQQAFLN